MLFKKEKEVQLLAPVQVGPFRMVLDPKDQVISKKLAKNKMYAPGMVREIQRLVKPGMQVIDLTHEITRLWKLS